MQHVHNKYSSSAITKGNVISKGYNHDRFTLYTSCNVMSQPFWKRHPLLFGWTDSNDRRENVWILVSSIYIPSLFIGLAPVVSYRHCGIMTYSLDICAVAEFENLREYVRSCEDR